MSPIPSPDPSISPYGWDVWTHTEVVPKPPPTTLRWRIGPVKVKSIEPQLSTATRTYNESEITVQLTADQQVSLSISGQDRYGNPVDIDGDTVWESSDENIVQVNFDSANPSTATALAVGPTGTASVTCTNDADRDGTGDFMGSLAIDVVAGDIAEIEIAAGTPEDKVGLLPPGDAGTAEAQPQGEQPQQQNQRQEQTSQAAEQTAQTGRLREV